MTQKNDQVWFITGANKGLGAAIAKEALDRGYKVVATVRNPESAEEFWVSLHTFCKHITMGERKRKVMP